MKNNKHLNMILVISILILLCPSTVLAHNPAGVAKIIIYGFSTISALVLLSLLAIISRLIIRPKENNNQEPKSKFSMNSILIVILSIVFTTMAFVVIKIILHLMTIFNFNN
jgi:hypothetical protein